MATHKSAEKASRQAEKRRVRNASGTSKIKTAVKAVRSSVTSGNLDNAKTAFKTAQAELAKAVTKGIIKKNTASRVTERLNKAVKKVAVK